MVAPGRSEFRTSQAHPLQIADVEAPGGGVIGITFCPGKHQSAAATGAWARDLAMDMDAVKAWGAGVVVTLVTDSELKALKVDALGAEARARGMVWLHLPIEDVHTPDAAWEKAWAVDRVRVHRELDQSGRVLVHCKGGLGRAGTVAARILVERGMAAQAAIDMVQRVRPGAIETTGQERHVRAVQSLR